MHSNRWSDCRGGGTCGIDLAQNIRNLGCGDLGFQGSSQIPTPHIDALTKAGLRFTQGYVSSAVCSPSRAGLLTGRNQVELGYDNNLDDFTPGFDPGFAGLNVQKKTIADRIAVGNRTLVSH